MEIEKFFLFRGAFSYVKRVTQKAGKMENAAKFISAGAKKKASALREMSLLSELDHERILYFHDAFETKNAVILITEMYPFKQTLFKEMKKARLARWKSSFKMSRCEAKCFHLRRSDSFCLARIPRGGAARGGRISKNEETYFKSPDVKKGAFP